MKCISWQGRTCEIGFCDACITCIHNPNRDRLLPHLQNILARRFSKIWGEEYAEIAYCQTERKTVVAMYLHTFSFLHRLILAIRSL